MRPTEIGKEREGPEATASSSRALTGGVPVKGRKRGTKNEKNHTLNANIGGGETERERVPVAN